MAEGELRSATDVVEGLGGKEGKDPVELALNRYREYLKKKKKYSEADTKTQAKLDEEINNKIQQQRLKYNKENLADRKRRLDEEYKYSIGLLEKTKVKAKSLVTDFLRGLAGDYSQVFGQVGQALNSGINKYLGSYSDYMGAIETRLQGADKNFKSVTKTISDRVGASQYVKQTQVLQNLSNLVASGINYNVELRAFLATVSENIATTFDAFDSNLTHIIRLQQADSTAARLGLEASLTKFFNANFKDTAYLSDVFDTVSQNLFAAESQLGRNESVAFEYNIQKWLGSLYSVGVSQSTISSIAQGLGYLGSGDISSLSSNDALQRLLVAATSVSGQNYGQLLTGGLNAEGANTLLGGIVKVMQDIARSGNQVVKSEYARLFGISISDMTAVLNLTDRVQDIAKSVLSYDQAYRETEEQMKLIPTRMTLKTRIDNLFDNIMAGVGENIANSAAQYTTWLLTDMIQQSGVDLSVTVMGTKVDPLAIIKGGIAGFNILTQLGTIFSGLSGNNQLSLSNWGSKEFIQQGFGFSGLSIKTSGVNVGSGSQYFAGDVGSQFSEEAMMGKATETNQEVYGKQQETQDQMLDIVKNHIAADVNEILRVLRDEGISVKNYGLTGLVGATFGI